MNNSGKHNMTLRLELFVDDIPASLDFLQPSELRADGYQLFSANDRFPFCCSDGY